MALPTLVRTWQFAPNNLLASTGTAVGDSRQTLRAIKDMMSGSGIGTWTDSSGGAITPTGSWTVIASSNSVTTSIGTDLWAADSNLVFNSAGSAHSWIVLQQTAIAPLFQVKIDLLDSTDVRLSMTVSHTGFGVANGGADGSTTVSPTALSSSFTLNDTNWGGSAAAGSKRVHVMRSIDGKATRILIGRNGHITACWQFELASTSLTGWTVPYIARAGDAISTAAPVTDAPTVAFIAGTTATVGVDTNGTFSGYMVAEGDNSAINRLIVQTQTAANSIGGEYPMCPIGFNSAGAAGGHVGRYGTIVDMWYGLTALATATTYPATGTLKQFMQAGCLIFPWNQSTPSFT